MSAINDGEGTATPNVPTAHAVALAVHEWARTNGVLSRHAAESSAVAPTVSIAEVGSSFRHPEILRRRAINYVLFNEPKKQVTICTQRKFTAKELKELPQNIGEVQLKFHDVGIASSGGPLPSPQSGGRYNKRNNAYCCGSSIHIANHVGAGTLGALVRDKSGNLFGLSNNHVTGDCSFAPPGLPIIAPGQVDVDATSIDCFTLGRHKTSLQMIDGDPATVPYKGNVDAAVFSITTPSLVSSYQGAAYDTPKTVIEPAAGMIVDKVGRTTGPTKGEILGQAIGPIGVWCVVSTTGTKKLVYYDQPYVVANITPDDPFSEVGDSGSLVTWDNTATGRQAVGLLFAGDGSGNTFILPIGDVLKALDLELVAGHNI